MVVDKSSYGSEQFRVGNEVYKNKDWGSIANKFQLLFLISNVTIYNMHFTMNIMYLGVLG